MIAFSLITNRYLRSDFEDLLIKNISLYLLAHCPHVILPCLRLARDFHQQFSTSGDLLIKHLFDFQLKSFQSRGIITWRITWYSFVHVKHPFDQPSLFIILLGWPFYNSKSFTSNGSASPFGRRKDLPLSKPIKSSTKMDLGGSRPCRFPCQNPPPLDPIKNELARDPGLVGGFHSDNSSPAPSRNPTPGPELVSALIPDLVPALALPSSNELFK